MSGTKPAPEESTFHVGSGVLDPHSPRLVSCLVIANP